MIVPRIIVAFSAAVGAAALGLAVPSAAVAAPVTQQVFSYTGAEQTFTVPAGVTSLHVVAVGARGGSNGDGLAGGRGGQATADVAVMPGESVYVEVGGVPTTTDCADSECNPGWNGGGSGVFYGGGGGGASDIRTVSAAADPSASLTSRLVVAGGGGGRGANLGPGPDPGAAGDADQNATDSTDPQAGGPGLKGTTTQGGHGGTPGAGDGSPFAPGSPGVFGAGGDGGTHGDTGGGGGGGVFGGGGGAEFWLENPARTPVAHSAGSGGGGASFAPGGTITHSTAAASVTLSWSFPTLNATSANPASGNVGFAYDKAAVTASGGVAPYSYALTSGTLPAGLSVDSSTGHITGTPSAAGANAVQITVTDSESQTKVVDVSVTVDQLTVAGPASVQAGDGFTLTGSNYPEGDYTVELHSAPVTLGTAHVGASGRFSFTGTIPAGFDPGAHQFQVLSGANVVATTAVTVTAAPMAAVPAAASGLATTGVNAAPIASAAAALLLLGIAALVIGLVLRRRGRTVQ